MSARRFLVSSIPASYGLYSGVLEQWSTCTADAPCSVPAKQVQPNTSYLTWIQSFFINEDSLHFQKYLKNESNSPSNEGMMLWPSLKKGLAKRKEDETLLQSMLVKHRKDLHTKDMSESERNEIVTSVADIVYGKGLTVQDRQAHLEKYGCATYTDEVLTVIADIARSKEGIVELGAGNGQWARQLVDKHKVDIRAFDSMTSLPLPNASHNPAATQYFYKDVQKGDERVFKRVGTVPARSRGIDGRALMIVFPDPGDMATKCLEAYVSASPENDVFIYVGEGRGGANANDTLFDLLESGKWTLTYTCKLKAFGDKGFERFFVFRKVT